MICFVISILSLLLFIQSLYSLSKLHCFSFTQTECPSCKTICVTLRGWINSTAKHCIWYKGPTYVAVIPQSLNHKCFQINLSAIVLPRNHFPIYGSRYTEIMKNDSSHNLQVGPQPQLLLYNFRWLPQCQHF